jgi:hypothetical protein
MHSRRVRPFEVEPQPVFTGSGGTEIAAVPSAQSAISAVPKCVCAMERATNPASVKSHTVGFVGRADEGVRHNRLGSVHICTGVF